MVAARGGAVAATEREVALRTRWWTLALLPALLLVFWHGGEAALGRLALGSALATGWQAVFARLRGRPLRADGWLTASGMLVLLGADVPLGQFCISLSFAMVFGEQVFGGRDHAFVSPAIVGVAFQWFGFGAIDTAPLPWLAVASAGAALGLALRGLICWRLLGAMALGWSALAASRGALWVPSMADPIWFAMLCLIGDPRSSAVTRGGRFLHGLLAGALVAAALPATAGLVSLAVPVFSLMLAGLFAPLTDRAVLSFQALRTGSDARAR